jgi:hypothetical protein
VAPECSENQVYDRVVVVAAAVSTLFSAPVGPEVRSEVLAVAVAAAAAAEEEEVEVLLYAKLWMEAVVVAAVEEEVGVLLSAKLWMKVVAAEAEVVVVLVAKMSKDQATALQFSEKERQRVLSGPKRSSLVKVRTYSRHYHQSRNGRYHSDQIV